MFSEERKHPQKKTTMSDTITSANSENVGSSSGGDVRNSVDLVRAAVEDLYHFRDHYFEQHSLEDAIYKTDRVEEKLSQTLNLLDSNQDSFSNKAELFMLRGKALNIRAGHSAEAQEALAKAVKLDPKLAEAWVHLGECYWKNKDVQSAKDCFEGALNHGKDKCALRNLSMVLRQVGSDPTERIKNTEKSVEIAKQAIQLDIKDGTSWFILGNAYLSLFFGTTQNAKILKQCLSAYQQAERDAIACTCSDLHFNRATAYKYQEEYELALMGFTRAAALDPTWPEPQEREKQLLGYLRHLQEMVKTKGKVRSKKLQGFTSSLKESDLGPYAGGSYTSPKGDAVNLQLVAFSQLTRDVNREKVVFGKVVCSVRTDAPVPFTVCLVDSDQSCLAMTIYNLAADYGLSTGDTVAIPEPFVQDVSVEYKGESFQYRSIRVATPVVLVINGRKLGLDRQAPTVLSVSAMSE